LIQSSSKNLEKELSEKIKLKGTISDNLTKQLCDNLEDKINKIDGNI